MDSTIGGDDQQLIRDACGGDDRAFGHLVRFYTRPLYNYCFRFLNRKEDVEDVLQETFLKAYKALGRYDQTRAFSSWLFTIATHTTYDWLRKKKRFPEMLIIDNNNDSIETIGDHRSYIIIEDAIDLDAALQQLRPEYKAVLLLYYYQSLPYEEIAAILSTPLNTVKTHLRRAKEALRIVYNKHNENKKINNV